MILGTLSTNSRTKGRYAPKKILPSPEFNLPTKCGVKIIDPVLGIIPAIGPGTSWIE
jgi:hypothetical protein